MRGRARRVYGTIRLIVYGTMRVRTMRVCGTMRSRAKCVQHNAGEGTTWERANSPNYQ